jgi:hypothetical protein
MKRLIGWGINYSQAFMIAKELKLVDYRLRQLPGAGGAYGIYVS